MKKFAMGIVAGICLLGGTAGAAEPGWFFAVDAGANIMNDFDLGAGSHFNMDVGQRLDGSVGYTFNVCPQATVSTAFETGFLYNSIDDAVNAAGVRTPIDGDLWQVPVLGKVAVRFMPDSKLIPYISVAGGGVYSGIQVRRVGFRRLFLTGDEWDPAVQGGAGLKYAFDDKRAVGLAYKCLVAFPDGYNKVINHSILAAFSMAF